MNKPSSGRAAYLIYLGGAAAVLLSAAPFLPTIGAVSLGTVATILAFLCAGAAGLSLPQVRFKSTGKPLIPMALVPLVASLVPIFIQAASAFDGVLSVMLEGLAYIAAFLTGLAAPDPIKRVNEEAMREVDAELRK